MRKNLITMPPELALHRVLAGLEPELVEATDEEIEQAARDLGMDIHMKGSAAFAERRKPEFSQQYYDEKTRPAGVPDPIK